MGNTSPNNKIKKVIKITSTENFKTGDLIAAKRVFPTNEKIITTPMWLKLLATNIVANNFFGRDNKLDITLAFDASWSCKTFKSFCDNEKNEISAAETIAEQNKRKIIAILPKRKFVSRLANKVKLG